MWEAHNSPCCCCLVASVMSDSVQPHRRQPWNPAENMLPILPLLLNLYSELFSVAPKWAKKPSWICFLDKMDETSVSFYFALSFVQLLSHVWLLVKPWTAAHQVSLSFTISQSVLKLMSIELVMPSNHLTLCCPLLLLPSIFPSIRVFSHELALHIRWPKYWSFGFSITSSSEYSRLI